MDTKDYAPDSYTVRVPADEAGLCGWCGSEAQNDRHIFGSWPKGTTEIVEEVVRLCDEDSGRNARGLEPTDNDLWNELVAG
jgi:hypothetical protein